MINFALPFLVASILWASVPADQELVSGGKPVAVEAIGKPWTQQNGSLVGSGTGSLLESGFIHGQGDSALSMELVLEELNSTAASFKIGSSHFLFDARGGRLATEGPLFGKKLKFLEKQIIEAGVSFHLRMERHAELLTLSLNGSLLVSTTLPADHILGIPALRPHRGTLRVLNWSATGDLQKRSKALPGTTVFESGKDGYATFRIPAIVRAANGNLLAFAEGRVHGSSDSGNIDLVMRRSKDGGKSWGELRLVADNQEGVFGNPAPVVDQASGDVILLAVRQEAGVHESQIRAGSKGSRTPYLLRSKDHGAHWSKPKSLLESCDRDSWRWYATGPNHGIQLKHGPFIGRLIIPANFSSASHGGGNNALGAHLLLSDDGGKSWRIGAVKQSHIGDDFINPSETTVAELPDGRLYINTRDQHGSSKASRAHAWSLDGGESFTGPFAEVSDLPSPVCQGAVLQDGARLLFSAPSHGSDRRRLAIRSSEDGGTTWREALMVDPNPSAYSDLVQVSSNTFGVLYERDNYQSIRFSTFERSALQPLSFAPVFSDHMVLQRNQPIALWGQASAKAQIQITFGKDNSTVQANSKGIWRAELSARPASNTPTFLKVTSGTQTVTLSDLLVGDVWICAGQSNMEFPMSSDRDSKTALAELALDGTGNGESLSTIRFFQAHYTATGSGGAWNETTVAGLATDKFFRGEWAPCNQDTLPSMSAVAYYFARSLRKNLEVPIGLVDLAAGGTPTEAWISVSKLSSNSTTQALTQKGNWLENPLLGDWCRERASQNLNRALESGEKIPSDSLGPNHAFKPGFMWKTAMLPFTPMPISGITWYQGESNAGSPGRVQQHKVLFPMLIEDCRLHWKSPKLPFLFVQLPAMNRPDWPEFREQQRLLSLSLPNVGMAVAIDVGHPTNVHPNHKRPVGERLAMQAMHLLYGDPTPYTGPWIQSVRQNGNEVRLSFKNTAGALRTSNGKTVQGFEIIDRSGMNHAVEAVIKGSFILIDAHPDLEIAEVRYAWAPVPTCNLTDANGLPASPFRFPLPQQ